jgi:hypothetical protein
MFDSLDVTNVGSHADTWERVVRKLRSGTMPPVGFPRPDEGTRQRVRSWLENELDHATAANLNPGRTEPLHRLNRVEYQNVVRELLDFDGVDFSVMVSADDASYGFDNIAGVLGMSSTHLDRYLSAARKISRMAVGDVTQAADDNTYRVPLDLSQDSQLEELPFGTRGGMLVRNFFPLDGEYVIKFQVFPGFGASASEPNQIEVSLDGERMDLQPIGPKQRMAPPDEPAFTILPDGPLQREIRAPVRAGLHDVAITFFQATSAEVDDVLRPFQRTPSVTLPSLTRYGGYAGPYLNRLSISGPFNVRGSGDTAPRRRIFVCRPASARDELPCARTILSTLARRAYRRPVTDADLRPLLSFFNNGHSNGGFEKGIQIALQRLLASPDFLFRTERDPENVPPGTSYRISDLELASRLSFFLWSSIPDDPLLDLAVKGKLKDPGILEQQVRRMLADRRSQQLVKNFAGQWLQLRNVAGTHPDLEMFPDFDETLRRAFRAETELFFDSLLHENRSVVELLTADYTFVNERLARHYDISGVYGSRFRRVTLTDPRRRGLLGQGSLLTVTSQATRTSPVKRGKWILENLLGAPPPPPLPNIPPLKEKTDEGRPLSMREAMAQHRSNPVCASCHGMMDPLGLSLEHFDAVGKWRDHGEGSTPIDDSGTLPDGTVYQGVDGLREAILKHPEGFAATVTEKLLVYALGRGLEFYDMPTVRSITRQAAGDNYLLTSLIVGITKSVPFQMRRAKP